jgi:hypothetical protein
MTLTQCSNCLRDLDVQFTIIDRRSDKTYQLCTIECVQEWAWKERESQPKLSKSKENASGSR